MLARDEVLAGREHDRLVDRLGDALGDADRLVRAVELLADDEELVAAEPRHGVGRAHGVVEPRGERDEQVVAGPVAHRVVDELELVEVGEQHRHRPAVAPAARERALEPVERERAVRQPRQRVVHRAVADLLVDAAAVDGAGDDVGHRAQEVGLVGREGAGGAGVRAEHAPGAGAADDRHGDPGARAGLGERGREGEARSSPTSGVTTGASCSSVKPICVAGPVGTSARRTRPVGPAHAGHEPQRRPARGDLEHLAQLEPERGGDGLGDAVHHRLEVLLLEREAAERGDRRLLARLPGRRPPARRAWR